jgi:adenosylhomocysteine nucleosidase
MVLLFDPTTPAAPRCATHRAMVTRIAILAPMPPELAPLREPLRLRRAGPRLFAGAYGAIDVIATEGAVGTAAAAAAAERLLDAGAGHLVVVGIAGGIGPSVAVGDLVVPERVLDVASGAELHPTPIGDVVPRGVLATADRLLPPAEIARIAGLGAIAIDMETAAAAAAFERRGRPWSVFRAVSDRADDGSTDAAIAALLGSDGRPDLAAVARFLLTRPHRIPQLVRLARGTNRAAATAAAALLAALRGGAPAR